MKKNFIYIILVVAVIAGIVFVLQKNKKQNAAKIAEVQVTNASVLVTAKEVKETPINLNFTANGNFQAGQEQSLLSENTGRITRLLVDEGSRVRAGQMLATIDNGVLNADVASVKANLDKAKRDVERYESSFKTGGVTQRDLDAAHVAYQTAQAQYASSQHTLQNSYLRAPISGVINHKYIEQGAYLRPGDKLFDIVDVSKLKLSVTVPEAQVVNLKTGTTVQITCPALPGAVFTGKVTFIAAKADNTLQYPVDITLKNEAGNQIKAGMYGLASFTFPQQKSAIVIDRTAFVGSVSSNQVYVMDQNKTARLTTITPGRILGDSVEVIKGLKTGDQIITSGQINLQDGAKVDVQKN
jgi:membrane fusion protein (multidrug efflux system)